MTTNNTYNLTTEQMTFLIECQLVNWYDHGPEEQRMIRNIMEQTMTEKTIKVILPTFGITQLEWDSAQ